MKAKNATILKYIEIVAQIQPAPIYWLDKNSAVLGVNQPMLEAIGAPSIEFCIGKTAYDVYPEDMARQIIAHNNEVMLTGKVLSQEESIKDINTGKVKYFTAIKAPLYGDDGEVIGLIGTSIEITAQKEAEQLRLMNERLSVENQIHKIAADEQEKFRRRAEQLAHDINSPLASLRMLAETYTDMPENYRLLLRKANDRIQDIAYDLLRDYNPKKVEIEHENNNAQPTLVSALLFEILSEKRSQYLKLSVTFSHKFSNESNFAFININRVAFARSISNIINNAVDALQGKVEGHVILHLDATQAFVKVTIEDNGKGIPQIIKDKLLNYEAITSGKKDGHGIGYSQIFDTINSANGKLDIDSTLGEGTQIIITFPRIAAPDWIIDEITLGSKDIVVVLDDDPSIHDAWRARFIQIEEEAPGILVEHFMHGSKALEFFEALTQSAKHRLFLLSDYELLKQDLNGLQIIQRSGIERAILVTSHYLDTSIRQKAMDMGVKILPKQLASTVAINIGGTVIRKNVTATKKTKNMGICGVQANQNSTVKEISSKLKKVDLVLLDDDKLLVENLMTFMFKNMKVDTYHVPEDLLKNIFKYSKNTKFVLDYNCGTNMSGIDLAKILHEKGYNNLFILSGENIDSISCGDYATAILKTDLDSVRKYLVKK